MEKTFDIAMSFATENEELAETVYHYLKAEGLSVFFAPAPECQTILSGENQREIFYRIFGMESRYVILLVSEFYVRKEVPMEAADELVKEKARNEFTASENTAKYQFFVQNANFDSISDFKQILDLADVEDEKNII